MEHCHRKSGAKSSGTAPGNVFRDGARAMSSGTAPRHHHHQGGHHDNAFRDSTRAMSLWRTSGDAFKKQDSALPSLTALGHHLQGQHTETSPGAVPGFQEKQR